MDHTLRSESDARRLCADRDAVDDLRLGAGATLAVHLPAGASIAVQSGRVWLTQSGDAGDHFVGAGQRHVLGRAGRVVVEADAALATLRISRAPADTSAPVPVRPGFP